MSMHSNDHGLSEGDEAVFLAYGWMRVPVRIISKSGSGFTRTATVQLLDPKSKRTGWTNDPTWHTQFTTNIKCLEQP